jgi:hypothetical protein
MEHLVKHKDNFNPFTFHLAWALKLGHLREEREDIKDIWQQGVEETGPNSKMETTA